MGCGHFWCLKFAHGWSSWHTRTLEQLWEFSLEGEGEEEGEKKVKKRLGPTLDERKEVPGLQRYLSQVPFFIL